ncbi:unnamed protein product [Nezara viridula]|uniref:Uncharacterized protein n=1 Tax=Nezara viridula TaxID=85310 RepID=A0A9P0HFX3_NEZVI|nr:unnamed protein product [Nezara viridula]
MGRKKLSLTDEERILRKKEQMKKVHERQKFLHPEKLEKRRARRRIENLKPEQLEKKRERNRTYYENIRNKRLKLIGLYKGGQVEHFNNEDLKQECDFCGALSFEEEISRLKNNCCHTDMNDSFVFIKEEKRDETESAYINDSFVFIKEEMTDEAESTYMSDSFVFIKEEKTDETESALSAVGLKEQKKSETYYGGLVHVKLEGESLVPEDGENLYY